LIVDGVVRHLLEDAALVQAGASLPTVICTLLHGILDLLHAPHADLRLTTPLCQLTHTLMAKLQELLPGSGGGGAGGGERGLPQRPYTSGERLIIVVSVVFFLFREKVRI
jgi:hypothetical protein